MMTKPMVCALAVGLCVSASYASAQEVEREAPAWSAVPRGDKAAPATVTFKDQIKAGTPVVGADGLRVGTVKSVEDENGKVTVIHVSTGDHDGATSSIVAITLDKVATLSAAALKLSVSAADAKKLPASAKADGSE